MGCSAPAFQKVSLIHNLKQNTVRVRCIYELPKGNIMTAGGDGKLYIWSLNYEEILEVVKAHFSQITALVPLKEKVFITASMDHTVRYWEMEETINCKESMKIKYDPLRVVRLSNRQFIIGCNLGIVIFDINPLRETIYISLSTPVDSLVLLRDGRIVGNSLYKIAIWNYKTKKDEERLQYIEGHEKAVSSLLQLRDGRLVSGGEDKKIFIWNIKDKVRLKELEGHKGPVISLYQLKQGNLVSGDKYCLIYFWSLDMDEIIQTLIEEGSILDFYQLKNYNLCSISSASEIKIWGV